jgi:glycosyltransferase involved in cell wall biosynthesis
MNRLVLSQIYKNEAHCILDCLNSDVKNVYDMVVYVDTGSTDNTKDLILKWGEENNIPAYVFERQFDNFENSRNYAMQKAKEMADKHGWKREETWTGWIDCDEKLIMDKLFNKQKLDKDLYMINTYIGAMKYTRNTFIRMSQPGRFYGPVHGFIICDNPNISSGLMEGLHVDVKMIGASWKGNIADKYKKHAAILEDYIDNKDRNSRWVFYTAQSYHDSATLPDNREENEERLRRSMKYYKERVNRLDGYEEERFYSQFRIGTIMMGLEMPWAETHQEFIKSYSMDPRRGEPIKAIIDHYLMTQEWHLAYVYTKFAVTTLHGNNPYPSALLFVDESLYNWKFLEAHSASCVYTGRKEEGRQTFNQLLDVLRKNPQWFNTDEVQKINMNAQFFK